MSELKINNTPVRTSKNYQINNIKLENIKFLASEKFDNILYQDLDNENIELSLMTSDFSLTYGVGKELENEVKQNSNVKLKLELKENTNRENIISFIFDEENTQLIDDIEIVANENVKGQITLKYVAKKDSKVESKYDANNPCTNLHNGVIRTTMKSNSELKLTVINLTSFSTTNILAIENILSEKSKLEYNIVDFGGDSSVTNYYTELIGDNSENNLNTIYLGINKQLLDMNYIAETRGKNTKVNIDVQGAIKDEARKHFKGTIDFKRGGKKAEGSENEFCMLLSDEAKSISLPMLLCDEEDVVGNHAAAAGKVNNKELFYLMSRGFTEKEAKTLMVRARFNKVIENISNEDLKNELLTEIDYRLL
ncbi:MAG: SufD family Fe-S cluster assembly protein [Clostridia bacterium]|nr:SufD family Fe-S cluster assembly protein [Clostridia bacterium]